MIAQPKRKKHFLFLPDKSSINEKPLYFQISVPSMDSLFTIYLSVSFSPLQKSSISAVWNLNVYLTMVLLCSVAQSCQTLCNPMDWNPPGSSVLGDSPGKNARVDCHVLLQGNLPKPGLKPRSSAPQADSLLTEPRGKSIPKFQNFLDPK